MDLRLKLFLNIYLTLIVSEIKNSNMRLNKNEREEFRRMIKILIPQMEKSEIANHFQKEGNARKTIYDSINRM